MSEIPKAYEPQAVEEKWYQFWLDQKCFVANPSSAKPAYSIVIPPPNVTGMLHMGHVLNNTIQDILSRKARMDGKEVLWLPGTDHAGIATQVQVERALKKEEKKTKHDLGREEFLKRVWAWKAKHGDIIINQLKKLGASCDWTRERFTMDPEYSRCVQKVFVELYKKGLIYRGKRMVNWCPVSQTALSDEEVEMKPQKGFMYHFKVQVAEVAGQASSLSQTSKSKDGDRQDACPTSENGRLTDTWLTIATTRPETIPGDTAVAVNPKDPRYAHLIGKHIVRPLPPELPREQKLIPIIGDEHVDFEFGTGVLKVTPAHDKADFEIGQRHKLSLIEVINADGSMNDLAGVDLKGVDRFKARKVAVEKLAEIGALVEEKPYENNVGFSQRADVPIEPRLSEQWFLKYPAVEQSKACVEQTKTGGEPDAVNQPEGLTEIGPGQRPGLAGEKGMHPERVPDGSTAPAGAGATLRGEPRTLSGANLQKPSGLNDNEPGSKMRFHPQRWAKVYDHWLTNIQDWCISRQLWWGHRIPVWSFQIKSKEVESFPLEIIRKYLTIHKNHNPLKDNPNKFSSTKTSLAKKSDAETYFEYECDFSKEFITVFAATQSSDEIKILEANGFTQDPDVLDTWFSSWLWPFATMGWPEQTETLKKFYPTTDLVTGPDIIFFWVARMIMAGYEYMGELPFKNVYFTGIIRDKQGRKMSKTLGNSPDPLELIAKYGADALRFGTMRSAPLGQDVLFDEKDVELGRNFCNKLWNACRFRQMVGQASRLSSSDSDNALTKETGATPVLRDEVQGEIAPRLLTSDDKWILLKLDQAICEITTALNEYKFSEATAALYRFFWSEYCDWYVEASKAALGNAECEVRSAEQAARRANTLAVIDFVLSHMLRLFHPFLPFITEELWHGMGYSDDMPEGQGGKTIMFAPWPKPLGQDFRDHYGLAGGDLAFAEAKQELVVQGRNLRREKNVPANKRAHFAIKPKDPISPHDQAVLKLLLNAEALDVDPFFQPSKGMPSAHTKLGEIFLSLEGLIDMAAEKARLARELEKADGEIAKAEQKLANPAFVQKVPPQVLQEQQKRLAEWQAKRTQAQQALDALGS